MWEDVRKSKGDFGWVVSLLERGTGMWVTDGLFTKELRDDISGVGWIFLSFKTGHKLTGAFHEESVQAGSYRGERLGLLTIHLLLAAITEHFGITIKETTICCDNKGGLYASLKRSPRVKAGAFDDNIDRVARRISKTIPKGIKYEWVATHQDGNKSWK